MRFVSRRSSLAGEAVMPASKSHTIRAVVIAALADGGSVISNPLDSLDTKAAVEAYRAFGAEIETGGDWRVRGVAGRPRPPEGAVDVANSGTTLYFAAGTAALAEGETRITGDSSIQRRPAGHLLDALRALGAAARSDRGDDAPPITIRGRMRGGKTVLRAPTSQYLSSLLLNCPLADADTGIEVLELNEHPYVEMTLDWLRRQYVTVEHDDGMKSFRVPGRRRYRGFEARVPGDFSTAAFFLVAAAVTGSEIRLAGLDMNDAQGDRAVVNMLEKMGVEARWDGGALVVRGGRVLRAADHDLNATPDALPAMAVAAACARGTSRLFNVPQARLKETDRIAVMKTELEKMGAGTKETPDGLIVEGAGLRGARLNGRADHRVVMALAVAGLAADGTTEVDTAESAAVTFPGFLNAMRKLGADIEAVED
ncbi:MAG: 3-phosphoshikimate 1-carboxyvinyltransferase [bacterium]